MYRRADRGNRYYWEEIATGKQGSLKTSDVQTARRLLDAKNVAGRDKLIARELGRTYLRAADPALSTRTWQHAMDAYLERANLKESTVARTKRALKSLRFDPLRGVVLTETTPEQLIKCATNASAAHYLRRVYNLATGLGWLPWIILLPRMWPTFPPRPKRAITEAEHHMIVASEANIERRNYYEMLWLTGAAQKDVAELTRANIDEEDHLLHFRRSKTDSLSVLQIGPALAKLLRDLPQNGALFPRIGATQSNERASEFSRRCGIVDIFGISLHSYRYAWAERAKAVAYPERWAQVALGHASKAVARAYARAGLAVAPALEVYEAENAEMIRRRQA
jgi:hypothetical protein